MDEVTHASQPTEEVVDGVHLTPLARGERMSVQHLLMEPGAVIEAHSHTNEQVGYVLEGTCTFLIDGTKYVIGPGDSYAVPAEEPHRVENRTEDPLEAIDVFSPPRDLPSWGD